MPKASLFGESVPIIWARETLLEFNESDRIDGLDVVEKGERGEGRGKGTKQQTNKRTDGQSNKWLREAERNAGEIE